MESDGLGAGAGGGEADADVCICKERSDGGFATSKEALKRLAFTQAKGRPKARGVASAIPPKSSFLLLRTEQRCRSFAQLSKTPS